MDETVPNIELSIPPAPVDGRPLLCPLCDYDLRGLIEPRCPECGYGFIWTELLDEKRNTHPYLFEHYPRNNIGSFDRTAIGGLNPLRFWRTLRPQMTPKFRRLLIYRIICIAIPTLFAGTLIVATAVADHFYPPNPWFSWLGPAVPAGWPPGPLPRPAWADALDELWPLQTAILFATEIIVVWTITTHLALLVFQESMAKARICHIHIDRCVTYSFDIGVWSGAMAIAMTGLSYSMRNGRSPLSISLPLFWIVICSLVLLGGARLFAAYRLYLAFNHAFWVIFSSQIIALLILLTLLSNLYNLRMIL